MAEKLPVTDNKGKATEIKQTGLYWPDKRTEVDRVILPFQTVETINESKADRDKLALFRQKGESAPGWRNKLIWGDNKYIMASLLPDFAGKINLIYIDPPFATGTDFSIDIRLGDLEWTKEASVIEEKAYRDTWGRGLDSYLQMMYDRLVLMRELLADNGSIYVHLDWRVGHCVKLIIDEIFGAGLFRNEIIWKRHVMAGSVEGGSVNFSRKTDIILYYSKGTNPIFNMQYQQLDKEELEKKFSQVEPETGRRYETQPLILPGDEPRLLEFPERGKMELPLGKRFAWNQETLTEKLRQNPYIIYWTSSGTPRQKKYIDEFLGQPCTNLWDDIVAISSGSGERLDYATQKPEALLERIIKTSSEESDLVADFFCGSGTTGAKAEKLGRRWIMADLSKFAIHTTRKRLLDISGCKPFEVLNLGNYQKAKLKENGIVRYVDFVLKLYRAEPVTGYTTIHGRKAGKMVHIGAVDSIVTEREIRDTVKECATAGVKAVDILGWDFEMGLHDLVDRIGDEHSVKIHLVQIPREALEVKDAAREEIRFFDLNYLDVEHTLNSKSLNITLKEFVISNPEYLPQEVREKVKKFTDYIDYWAVDFNFRDDTFHNMWQSFRTKKHPNLETKSSHAYEQTGKYQVLVKVVDIFGNDTNKLIDVEVS